MWGFGERQASAKSLVSDPEWNSDSLEKRRHSELGSQFLLLNSENVLLRQKQDYHFPY
jgi:hypothetical protein